MTILVTGATGGVGRLVLDQLLTAGSPVRATSRNPQAAQFPDGVDVRVADLTEPDSFQAALDGVRKVFLYANPAGIKGFLDLAKDAGVRHIVLLSTMAATDLFADSPIRRMHVDVEQAIEQSGIDWTFLRPGSFATNTLAWAKSIKAEGVVRLPFPEARLSPIHEGDIAAVGARALLEDGHTGNAYLMTGPEDMTQRRQVEVIGSTIGRDLAVVELTKDEARAQMREQFGQYAPDEIIDTMLDYQEQAVGHQAERGDGVEQVLGSPGRTFAEWAVDHKADFVA